MEKLSKINNEEWYGRTLTPELRKEAKEDLELKLNRLIGEKISKITVDESGLIKIEAENGSSFSFDVPRERDLDVPDFDELNVDLK